jgi:regulator of G-protein signaling
LYYYFCLLAGEDFIEWLAHRLNIVDEEAKHLATLFCQYGYIFPVTDPKVLLVKDDGSLYRFQVSRCLLLFSVVLLPVEH